MRDLARAARTCREMHTAYVHRVLEERAGLIALGRQTYGEGMFDGIVRASQRALCRLEPFSGGPPRDKDAHGRINTAGELECARGADFDADQPRCGISRYGGCTAQLLSADVEGKLRSADEARWYGERLSCITIRVRQTRTGIVRLEVEIGKEANAPAVGLLSAICTENPEALGICFQRVITAQLTVLRSRGFPLNAAETEEAIGPVGLLVQMLTIYAPSYTTKAQLGQKLHARPQCVFDRLTLYGCSGLHLMKMNTGRGWSSAYTASRETAHVVDMDMGWQKPELVVLR